MRSSGSTELVVADKRGRIEIIPEMAATGMEGGAVFRLEASRLIRLPEMSQLFILPSRMPVGYDTATGAAVPVPGSFAVAAFLPPGFTATHTASYREIGRPRTLPLFAYTAVAHYRGALYAAALLTDRERRHDQRFIDLRRVTRGIRSFRKIFPSNRLVRHLEQCALLYGCPGAQNFFLSRYEGPLPVSPSCNARCAGCISYQPEKRCPETQPRITFTPTPEEIAEIAVHHIRTVDDPVVSFGQGCEGEPLMKAPVIARAIALIRQATKKGAINMNTNASRPDALLGLFDAGLDSIRVSMNSVREAQYTRYYRPRGYAFADVLRSLEIARRKGRFVSLNYLTMPGFTDAADEFAACRRFIRRYGIAMIQWRNLNFDPAGYFRVVLPRGRSAGKTLGIRSVLGALRKEFPNLLMGYYNPRPSTLRVAASRHRRHRG